MSGALPEADDAQRRLGARAAIGLAEPGEEQRQLDVATRIEDRDQVEELEDEADVARAERGELVLGERVETLTRDLDAAAARAVEPRDQVEQRALARARGTHQRDEAAALDAQADVRERVYLVHAAPVHAGNVSNLDQIGLPGRAGSSHAGAARGAYRLSRRDPSL